MLRAGLSGDNKRSGRKFKMKIYTVYTKPQDDKTIESAVFVPEAFSWNSIIFPWNFAWSIMNRAWILLVVLLVYFFFSLPESVLGKNAGMYVTAIKLPLLPFLGVWGNDLWRLSLKNRGYRLDTVVSGKNESEAQLRYFERFER